jgi:hypothetical protein
VTDFLEGLYDNGVFSRGLPTRGDLNTTEYAKSLLQVLEEPDHFMVAVVPGTGPLEIYGIVDWCWGLREAIMGTERMVDLDYELKVDTNDQWPIFVGREKKGQTRDRTRNSLIGGTAATLPRMRRDHQVQHDPQGCKQV